MPVALSYDRGTILIRGGGDVDVEPLALAGAAFDARVDAWRTPGRYYRNVVSELRGQGIPYEDGVRDYGELSVQLQIDRKPFPYQKAAVEAWWQAEGRGVVVLPTGAGKTFVAELAMLQAQRDTLVVTPTIDLMQQWYGVLGSNFGIEVGLLGGGYHEPKPVTVSTYDSAYLHMERLGNRFGFVVFDECHHLPGPSYLQTAEFLVAPFRLGLTATLEREDGEERRLVDAVGDTVFRQEIKTLAGEYLADYETVKLRVHLSDEERECYHQARTTYRDFVARNRLFVGSPDGWSRFLMLSSRSEDGRRAFLAYREQKRIAQASRAKLHALEKLLAQHRHERVLIFTSDNDTVYSISRRFLIPAITHQTKVKERHDILQNFNAGDYPFLVTSKVLNEGVDVPAASIGVILSGSGSVREHVQRLGRILRRAEDKRAILYEVVTEDTSEEFVSSRRRKHSAYQ